LQEAGGRLRVLVTGADGFVGKWLCAELLGCGHQVIGAVRGPVESAAVPPKWRDRLAAVEWISLELLDADSVEQALARRPEGIIHLAAIASGAQARSQPVGAWQINCLGTCQLAYAMERLRVPARLVFASTGEVYGRGLTRPMLESDPVVPCSPYAASKAAAEHVILECHRRAGLDAVIGRSFAQAGPGQRAEFVVPALARRILEAAKSGQCEIPVGNLEPVREFVDVRDVAAALRILLEQGAAGETYNIARGNGIELAAVCRRLAALAGWQGQPRSDPSLHRTADIPYLVGNGERLAALGWRPRFSLDDSLRDLLADLQEG
jgi:GDP-4-dehydro-6-deoxy-D-mannose reductase